MLKKEFILFNTWEKFNETPLPDRKELYSNLTTEDITDKN